MTWSQGREAGKSEAGSRVICVGVRQVAENPLQGIAREPRATARIGWFQRAEGRRWCSGLTN